MEAILTGLTANFRNLRRNSIHFVIRTESIETCLKYSLNFHLQLVFEQHFSITLEQHSGLSMPTLHSSGLKPFLNESLNRSQMPIGLSGFLNQGKKCHGCRTLMPKTVQVLCWLHVTSPMARVPFSLL